MRKANFVKKGKMCVAKELKEICERIGSGNEKGKFPFKLAKIRFSLLKRKRNSVLPRGFRGANVTPC